jgi:glycosyltransferase involved in cell wall biosynthesis
VAGAAVVLVGSHHTAASLWQAIGDPTLPARTRLGPPGVEVDSFLARERPAALAGVSALAEKLEQEAEIETAESLQDEEQSAFARDPWEGARAIGRLDPERDRLVIYVGKLIVSKGVDLLLACWPLVLEQVPDARLLVVGFGAYRAGLERLTAALGDGDLEAARALTQAGRSIEDSGAPARPLRHLLAFLDGLAGQGRESYLAASARLGERVVFSGRLDHGELVELLPACEALVAPSTFPEAFGMVAAEAAACGVLPVSAAHSGLAEVSRALAEAIPAEAAPWLSFAVDDGAVRSLAERIVAWLQADDELRERTRAGLVATVRERWSWDGVARSVIAAAEGRLDALPEP